MKLIKLEIGEKFRSLHAGFSMDFHSLDQQSLDKMIEFQPFCFAGLNGSGKSNVLEALAAIFYHLEFCVAKYRPEAFDDHFNRAICTPNAFTLQYLTDGRNKVYNEKSELFVVTIIKKKGEEPSMQTRLLREYDKSQIITSPAKKDFEAVRNEFLPAIVAGYSSGENEILSLPFIKNRLVQYDEYIEALEKNRVYKKPETSLVYIDNKMSQAVLLSILLCEEEDALKPLEKELHIKGLRSFRINLNLHRHRLNSNKNTSWPILQQLEKQIDKLKICATSWFSDDKRMYLDFYVDEETKKAFRDNYKSSFELFRVFQILYELNLRIVKGSIKNDVYSSNGYHTDGKLPTGSPDQNVFYFSDYLILKQVPGESKPIELLLRNFSDGEHQFLHTMGICLMLKDRSSLLLLDEPETHFNPGWRAKFIKVLNDTVKAGGGNNMMKEILLSSHSPFIISDCMPNNVVVFEKNETSGEISATTANKLDIRTFGTSIEEISDKIFKYDQSIGELSNSELEKIDFDNIESVEDIKRAKQSIRHLGDSIEKDLVLARLNQILIKINS